MSRDELYLRHILDAIQKIERYVEVGHGGFIADSMRHDAVIRQIEIIGEAAKRLSQRMIDQHPSIPWRQVAGMRDVLIHNYMGVDTGVAGGRAGSTRAAEGGRRSPSSRAGP